MVSAPAVKREPEPDQPQAPPARQPLSATVSTTIMSSTRSPDG